MQILIIKEVIAIGSIRGNLIAKAFWESQIVFAILSYYNVHALLLTVIF